MSEYDVIAPRLARQRALILQILRFFPEGLTTQQVIQEEANRLGYTFLTDNRLRELRAKGYVENVNELGKPLKWRIKH